MSVAEEMSELKRETRALVEASRENSSTIGDLSYLVEEFNTRVNRSLNDTSSLTVAALSSLETELFMLRHDLTQALSQHSDAIHDHAGALRSMGSHYVAGQVVGGLFKMWGSAFLSLGMVAAATIIADGMSEKTAPESEANEKSGNGVGAQKK